MVLPWHAREKTEIRTGYLSNNGLQRYHYIHLHSNLTHNVPSFVNFFLPLQCRFFLWSKYSTQRFVFKYNLFVLIHHCEIVSLEPM